jgi:predicted nucleotidyltransferase
MTEFGLNKKDLEAINAVFFANSKIESVKIFGSRAKGNYRKNSDIDLVLIGKINQLDAQEVASNLDDIALPYLFDVKVFNEINSPELLDHINRVGVFIYNAKP